MQLVETRNLGAIKMFAVLCCDRACGLSAGDMGGPDRQETGGISSKSWREKIGIWCACIVLKLNFYLARTRATHGGSVFAEV